MEATSNNANIFSQRSHLYIKQRGFAFAAARAYKPTVTESHDANDILRQLKGYRCTVYSAAYTSFLNEHTLKRSLRSLKLLFLDLEAGFIKPIIPNDDETIWTTIAVFPLLRIFPDFKEISTFQRKFSGQRKVQENLRKFEICRM